MFEIDGLRYDSLSALCKANTASIDQSVHADISMSTVWTSAHSLPQDAASRYWQQPREYARISEEQNNAAFAKHESVHFFVNKKQGAGRETVEG